MPLYNNAALEGGWWIYKLDPHKLVKTGKKQVGPAYFKKVALALLGGYGTDYHIPYKVMKTIADMVGGEIDTPEKWPEEVLVYIGLLYMFQTYRLLAYGDMYKDFRLELDAEGTAKPLTKEERMVALNRAYLCRKYIEEWLAAHPEEESDIYMDIYYLLVDEGDTLKRELIKEKAKYDKDFAHVPNDFLPMEVFQEQLHHGKETTPWSTSWGDISPALRKLSKELKGWEDLEDDDEELEGGGRFTSKQKRKLAKHVTKARKILKQVRKGKKVKSVARKLPSSSPSSSISPAVVKRGMALIKNHVKVKKGSPEAKAKMAALRAMRNAKTSKKKKVKGGLYIVSG